MERVNQRTAPELRVRKTFNNKTLKAIKRYKSIYIMMIPVLLYFLIFSYYPLVLGIVQSFQKSKLIGTPEFAGFDNYREVLTDYQFRGAFINSLIMGIGTLVLNFFASLLLALGINEVKNKFVRSAVQTVSYLPNLFSWTVVGGMWVFILSTNGLLNSILSALELESVQFMAEERLAHLIMILTATWKGAGYNAVLFLASIISMDPGMFESAQIDGASRLRQIFSIIIPNLVPTMKVIIVLGTMGLLRNFDQVFVMENAAIMDKVRTLLLFIYNEGITNFKVGKATAGATIVLIATLIISFSIRKLVKYEESY